MANYYLVEIEIHKRAAVNHQKCADYHNQAAALIERNNIKEAKELAQSAMNSGELAYRGTLAACVEDMAWETKSS